jgi:hypothetical protein
MVPGQQGVVQAEGHAAHAQGFQAVQDERARPKRVFVQQGLPAMAVGRQQLHPEGGPAGLLPRKRDQRQLPMELGVQLAVDHLKGLGHLLGHNVRRDRLMNPAAAGCRHDAQRHYHDKNLLPHGIPLPDSLRRKERIKPPAFEMF